MDYFRLYVVLNNNLFLIATFPPLIVNQASKNHRILIISISYSLAIILGSFVPAINELLTNRTHMLSSPACLAVLFSVISFPTTLVNENLQLFKVIPDIIDISKHSSEQIKVCFLLYSRFYDNGCFFELAMTYDWCKHYFEKHMCKENIVINSRL